MLTFSQKSKLYSLTFLIIGLSFALQANAQIDTDRDGYDDQTEIINNYDPFSPCGKNIYEQQRFVYEKGRLVNREDEQCRAKFLKSELERILGKGNIKINANDWHTVVNAFIYGGYSPEDIAAVIKYGAKTVHPTIAKDIWRNSIDYRASENKPDVARMLNTPESKKIFVRENTTQPTIVESTRLTSLDPKTVIFGFVFDQNTKYPLSNAELKLYLYTNPQKTTYNYLTTAKSDAAGYYMMTYNQLVSLDKSNLFIRVDKPLYGGADYNMTFDRFQIRQVDFSLRNRGEGTVATEPTETQTYPNKLMTVTLTDTKGNPLYNVTVSLRIDETAKDAVTFNSALTGVTGVDGTFVIAGTIDPKFKKSIPAYLTFSHPLLKAKTADEKIDIKSKKDKTIKFDYIVPTEIKSTNASKWQTNLIIAQEQYEKLTDERNINELQVIVVDVNTKRTITDYILSNIDRNTYNDIDGVIDSSNFSPDMYFAKVSKSDPGAKSGYLINNYFRVDIKPSVKTKVTLFIDPSKTVDLTK